MSRPRINFDNLSKEDKKRLKDLLQRQQESLAAALQATNKELYDLTNPKKTKKTKKSKKAKKAKS
jgi:hypothetical protein